MSVSRSGRFISRRKGPPAHIAYETGWAAEKVRTLCREEAKLDLLYIPSAKREWVKS
jgi:hypothetical protein